MLAAAYAGPSGATAGSAAAGPAGAVAGGAYAGGITVTTSTPVNVINPITINAPQTQTVTNVIGGGGGAAPAPVSTRDDLYQLALAAASRPRVIVIPIILG